MKYIREFLIGSSYLISLPFFYFVYYAPKKNYDFLSYVIGSPIWFGLWNVISLVIAEKLGLSMRMRFFIISIISAFVMMFLVKHFKAYKFNKLQWNEYNNFILGTYLIIWNFVIYYINLVFT